MGYRRESITLPFGHETGKPWTAEVGVRSSVSTVGAGGGRYGTGSRG